MLGRIRWGSGRKAAVRVEQILGLSVLTAELPQSTRRPERAVRKGSVLLRSHRVRCVLTPPGFPWWPILLQAGLRPVDTGGLRFVLAPVWLAVQLERLGIPREEAVLRLKGEGGEPALDRLAWALCPQVRGLVFDLPDGERAANRLRGEMGIPILPRDFSGVHLTLHLQGGPVLAGAEVLLPGRKLPTDCDRFPLVCALWETGRIKAEEIALKI